MKNPVKPVILSFLVLLGSLLPGSGCRAVGYPSAIYDEYRITPFPINDVGVKMNPTELLWPSIRYWEKRDVLYNVYLSRDPQFRSADTQVSKGQRYCFYNPHKALSPGKWYWKYEIVDNGNIETKGVYSFIVPEDAVLFETPDFEEFKSNIGKGHPRVMTQGNDIDVIRREAVSHPAYQGIVDKAEKILEYEIYDGPLGDSDPAVNKRITVQTGKEVGYFNNVLQGYVLTGDKALLDNMLERLEVLLTWPTNDLLGSGVLTALSMSYDILYDELSAEMKQRMLERIEQQMKRALGNWSGSIETRQVENHFWQMEVAGNFSAALATVHDLDIAEDMLEYLYELFFARFPNLSEKYDGGWAEGMGYFGVNKSCVVDMAVWMKKLGNVNVFEMPWYRNLPDFYTYFAPVGGQIAGFGDMHDRRANGNGEGLSAAFILSCETRSPAANYRLVKQLDAPQKRPYNVYDIEPWYQIVNSVKFDESTLEMPGEMPDEKIFYSTGMAAMHSDIDNVPEGTSVYFRSSPFGAKGHMHANQNCFNIARRGERIFYSTGYYTSFADPHSMTSYRNTRAANTILVNGCGQAFGHEGYGFIKRSLAGDGLTYVCGDATAAYKPTTDKQFLSMNAGSGVKETSEYGVGDAKLKLFERHLVYLRPDIVVVYDVLESEQDCDWTFLLHTMKNQTPEIGPEGTMRVSTPLNTACVNVYGSMPLDITHTTKFFSPAIDFMKKYREVPEQNHISYKSEGKSKAMRFLAVLQLGDNGCEILPAVPDRSGKIKIGEVTIKAELDASKPAKMTVRTPQSVLEVRNSMECTILKDSTGKKVCGNQYPERMLSRLPSGTE